MADNQIIRLTRKELSELTNNPKIIKALENLTVSAELLPDQVIKLTLGIETSQQAADGAAVLASAALGIAEDALYLVTELDSRPVLPSHEPQQTDASIEAQISDLRAQVAVLQRQFDDLTQGPTP